MPEPITILERLASNAKDWMLDARGVLIFLTRLPVTMPEGGDRPLGTMARAFPLAGLVVGGIGALVAIAADLLGLPPMAVGLAGLAAMAFCTCGLHEDGFADLADGFGGGHDKEAKIRIMRDSRIGAFGVLALIFGIGLKAAALATIAGIGAAQAGAAILAAACLSRAAMVSVMHRVDPARDDGLAKMAGPTDGRTEWQAVGLGVALCLLFLGPVAGGAALAAGAIGALVIVGLSQRHIGGYTGDVLGAVQFTTETAALLAVAALMEP